MRTVAMDCGSLLPLLDRERFADSKAAASRRTPKRHRFHVQQTASAGVPSFKILHPAFVRRSGMAPHCAIRGTKTATPNFQLFSPDFTWFQLVSPSFTSRPPRGGPHAPSNIFRQNRQSSPENFPASRPFANALVLSILHSAFRILHSLVQPGLTQKDWPVA
jgi:hypothetical protein